MHLSLFSSDPRTAIIILLLSVPVILLSLTVHECAHGYVAYLCGDSTAKAFGRLSLSPAKHLDLMGTLCMLIAGFGWAKPVPVNMRYLRKHKRDMVLVSLAGPASNLLLAFLAAAFAGLTNYISIVNRFYLSGNTVVTLFNYAHTLFCLMVIYNIGLALFNLIPLPPLDGSKILAGLLPNHLSARYLQIQRYTPQIFLAIMLLSFTSIGDVLFLPLLWGRTELAGAFLNLFEWIFESIG